MVTIAYVRPRGVFSMFAVNFNEKYVYVWKEKMGEINPWGGGLGILGFPFKLGGGGGGAQLVVATYKS